MHFDFTRETSLYRWTQGLKKDAPALYGGGVVFNQKILTACGKIDHALHLLSKTDREKFIADNPQFFEKFAWIYYQDWRKMRAKGCAALLDIYKVLNVKLTAHHFRGETFYAGIPEVTVDEINAATNKQQALEEVQSIEPDMTGICLEKVGIDGKLHKCDQWGYFPNVTDFADIYGDGTGVTKADLDAVLAVEENGHGEYYKCMSCEHYIAEDDHCIDNENFTCFEKIAKC
jgi:hypothetical protein